MTDHLNTLRRCGRPPRRGRSERGGDQRAKGRAPPRERLSFLLDEGSFQRSAPSPPRLHRLGMAGQALPRGRGRLRVREDQRRGGRLRPRLHGAWRLLLRRAVPERSAGFQDLASRAESPSSASRLRRGADPGGPCAASPPMARSSPARTRLRRHPPDLGRARPCAGGRPTRGALTTS